MRSIDHIPQNLTFLIYDLNSTVDSVLIYTISTHARMCTFNEQVAAVLPFASI